ncbi:MAG: type II secretion system F family protein [Endomicrobiaceae bacterium]|nr:type II secretion system F family protein [Endomicrobiaceae bacterium]
MVVYTFIKYFILKININKKIPSGNLSKNKRYLIYLILIFLLVSVVANIIFATLSIIIMFYVNWSMSKKQQENRIRKIDKQIIEAIRIFKNTIMTGQSVIQAVDAVSNQTNDPLASEFKKVYNSVSFGISLDDALKQTSQNIQSQQYKLFIDSIRISNVTGAKLSDILDKIERSITQQIAIYSKVEALTAQGKISGLIVSVIPFFIILLVYFLEPDIMGVLFTTTLGNLIFFVSVIMLLLGSVFMRKTTEINI